MRIDFEQMRFDTAQALMREAGWDPQTHDVKDWGPLNENLAHLMNTLAQYGSKPESFRKLRQTCQEISEYLNGRYRLQKSEKLEPDSIQKTIKEHLHSHYKLPQMTLVK